jgi:phage gp29-like protein
VIETDCHLRNLFEQRGQAVAGKPWVIQPSGSSAEDKLAADVLQAALSPLPMVGVWEHQLTFNRYGYGASEIDWDVREIAGREWIVPTWFANVPARRFKIDERDQLRLITADAGTAGEPLAAGKWIVTRRNGGRLARQALMRSAIWPAKFKRDTFGDWYIFCQKYGLPFTLVKYLLEGDEETKETAYEIIESLPEDGGAMITKDFEVEIKERSASSSDVFSNLIDVCNRELSKLINGSTLSNDNGDSGGASYALGDVHDSVRFESVQYDCERVQESFRLHVAEPFVRFNGLAALAPTLSFHIARDATPKQFLDNADAAVNKLGVRISRTQLKQVTGLREPLNDADAIERAPAAAPSSPQEASA